jgi:hypothetical protein
MPKEEQDRCSDLDVAFDRRRTLLAIKELAAGNLPTLLGERTDFVDELIKVPVERFRQARREAEERRSREIDQTPIDDNAWQEELRYRARLEAGDR